MKNNSKMNSNRYFLTSLKQTVKHLLEKFFFFKVISQVFLQLIVVPMTADTPHSFSTYFYSLKIWYWSLKILIINLQESLCMYTNNLIAINNDKKCRKFSKKNFPIKLYWKKEYCKWQCSNILELKYHNQRGTVFN